jgi:hypothetical protein
MKRVMFSSKPNNYSGPNSADAWVSDRPVETEPTKRLTVDIPLSLHLRVKSQCALHNRLISDVVREILENHFVKEYDEATGSILTTDNR